MYLVDQSIQLIKDIVIRFPRRMVRLVQLLFTFRRFKQLDDRRFNMNWTDLYPCLDDNLKTTPFDQHYVYHPAWAARVLASTKPEYHVDISSILSFSTIVSAFVPVRYYDYRPADLQLPGMESGFSDLLNLPFETDSISSLSCMHTIEHVGLGRYGDKLDPQGDLKAIAELIRVLAPGGNLLFVTPVGKPKIAFNAHRVYGYSQIIEYFSPLVLQEFTLIPDEGGIISHADPSLVMKQQYGCGCFWFSKPMR